MTESTKTAKDVIQESIDQCIQASEDAEKRRKAASTAWELYKVEFSAGEKKAYEEVAKKLKAVLGKL